MALKSTQWLAMAMLLSLAVAASVAKQEDAPAKPLEASVAARKHNDYHKDSYHKEEYHKDDYPKGGDYYPKGGDYYPDKEYPSDYYPNKGDYYPDAGYGSYPSGSYPNYGSYSGYPSYPNYGYPSNNYPHDGYAYSHDNSYSSYSKGHYLYLPKPTDLNTPDIACPAPSGVTDWGRCSVTCLNIAPVNGVYELGCFVQSTSKYATLTCPGRTQAVNCDCDCAGDDTLTACVSNNIGGIRKTCLSICTNSGAQVRALCE